MVKIKKKLFFIQITEVWFEYKFKWSDLLLPVAYLDIKDKDQKFYFGKKDDQKTVALILDPPIEELFANFRTTVKTEIRKATKEGIQCYFNDDKESFIGFFNDFAASKGLFPTDKRRLDEMGESLKMSFAVLNGEILAAHSFIEDTKMSVARQIHSASKRFDEKFDRNMIARANRLLHYTDMIYFKENGIRHYDFGGYIASTELQGLLDFKLSFGTKIVHSVNFTTYPYLLIMKFRDLFWSLKKKNGQVDLNDNGLMMAYLLP